MSAHESQHSAGWYAGALVFWLLTAWLITVGLSSIIPQIFPPIDVSDGPLRSCGDELRALRGELLRHASAAIAEARGGEGQQPARVAFLERWDERLFQARPSCREDEHAAWVELSRLRYGLEGLLDRFDHELIPRLERLDQLLGAPASEANARTQRLENIPNE